jgi:ribosomal protein S27E
MTKQERSVKEFLAVRCPTCGAKPGQKCKLSTGQREADFEVCGEAENGEDATFIALNLVPTTQ